VFDSREVVQEAVVALREKFDFRRVTLELDLPEQPVCVDADPARLQQIVVNLLDNASKYNRPGGHAKLTLTEEASWVVLKISDDGVGIAPNLLESIFEPFVQGRATIHRTEGGMGVGLSVVRSLVEMHDGTVTAESRGPGKGSTFIVRLAASKQPIASGAPTRDAVSWVPGKKVVLVEDNQDGREMMELLLRHAGYEVFVAGDGQSGLETIEREKPDIALVDIGLPIMDGFELARRVRSGSAVPNLYMIALTGYGQAHDHSAALDAGFDEHLVKPLNPEELARLLSQRREPE
jgi:two-component system CheB/CheR fusion protein